MSTFSRSVYPSIEMTSILSSRGAGIVSRRWRWPRNATPEGPGPARGQGRPSPGRGPRGWRGPPSGPEGARERSQDVGGGDEQHVGEVEVGLEIVVAERVVLGRVEDLEQGRRRVTPPVGAHLVHLV